LNLRYRLFLKSRQHPLYLMYLPNRLFLHYLKSLRFRL